METEKQSLVASFMEIAVCDSAETARQFLQATSWQLEEAIQLFLVGNEGNGVASSSLPKPPEKGPLLDSESSVELNDNTGNENVRPPLPVKREALYDDAFLHRGQGLGHPTHQPHAVVAFRNFEEEAKHSGVWDSDQSAASTVNTPRDNLASLYRPPFALMYHGTFEQAKLEAARQGKWLIVNLQSTKEFSSHMLNRDTWSNEAVTQTISTGFIFWQIYEDTDDGRKICTYYNLVKMPIVLVLDPITGQKMRAWSGMIEPQRLLEDLLPYMDKGPNDHHLPLPHKRPRESYQNDKPNIPSKLNEEEHELLQALAASMECMKESTVSTTVDEKRVSNVNQEAETCSSTRPIYPELPEEPKGARELLCRVGIRLPDGKRLQRNFLRTDSIQLLWSFCCSQLKEAESRPFRLTQAIPGASKCLDYESNISFQESGLANSMISLTWE